ncbi:hypothetical protein LINPERPRIM_LOCUS30698, partial [Linum perenne]
KHITLVLSIYHEEEPLIANWASTRTLPSQQSKGNITLWILGFANAPGFLAPFRGYTSHFQEIRRRGGPRGREELFNYRHSSLRNVIERCFGVLKRR